MDIIQPPSSDIIPASVLTTQGDIIVRGVAAPQRLAIGTTKQLLHVNAGVTGLEYGPPLGTSKQFLRVNAAANDLEYGPTLGVPRSVLRVTDAGNDEIFTFLPDMFQKARIYKASATQSIPYNTLTTITFDTDDYDSAVITDLPNERIIPSLAGYYIVMANVVYSHSGAQAEMVLYLRKTGVTETILRQPKDFTAAQNYTFSGGYVAYFDGAANYVDMAFFHLSADAVTIQSLRENTWLSVLGPF